ncbi:hypothetical protein DTO212C5_3298 [Paecilomyces variotii]|nr:hypothetical protein DTO212C5_3298 [Paecilomyces variotii]
MVSRRKQRFVQGFSRQLGAVDIYDTLHLSDSLPPSPTSGTRALPQRINSWLAKGIPRGRHIVLRSMNTLPQKPCLLNTLFWASRNRLSSPVISYCSRGHFSLLVINSPPLSREVRGRGKP